ncbi:MAG: dockerin type I repeat-containing protein [candidate division Zixibacteria bacterium]|nr:dockerin type I repeat-containing protein [candidate division Zixibacteria bacterium]
MGETDPGWRYCGWNIDDIHLLSLVCGGVCGDVNGDGEIDIEDAVYLINYLFTDGPPPQCQPITVCGDVDNDGKVNIVDVVYLINYLFSGGPPPSC